MTGELADDLAHLLDGEPSGLSCRELRRRAGRRLSDVLVALEDDPRFEHSGRRRGSKWRLATEMPASASRVRLGSIDLPWDDLDPSGLIVVGREARSA
jgi:hypothetical protein